MLVVSGDPLPKATSVPGDDTVVSAVGTTTSLDVTGTVLRSLADWLRSPAKAMVVSGVVGAGPAKAMLVSGVVGAGPVEAMLVSGVVGTDAPIGEIVLKPVSTLGGS